MLLNLAVGGNFVEQVESGVVPAEMEVDWVRVWQVDEVKALPPEPSYPIVDGGGLEVNQLVTLSQPSDSHWTNFNFSDLYSESPVVIPSVLTTNDGEPAVVGLSNITSMGMDVQIDEWDYLDGEHGSEDVGFLMLEPGQHDLGGLQAEAGVVMGSGVYKSIQFEEPFLSQPIVLAHVVNEKGDTASTVRVRNVGLNGFTIGLQQQELSGAFALSEPREIHYIALEQGDGLYNGRDVRVGLTGSLVSHVPYELSFGANVTDSVFYAQDQSTNGGDTSSLRISELSNESVLLSVVEEQSKDLELVHNTERVGWVVLGR